MSNNISFNSDVTGLYLLNNIVKGLNFDIPNIDFNEDKYNIPENLINKIQENIKPVTIEELTSKEVNGTGSFDVIMASIKNHLKEEYEDGRITGADYANAYISLTNSALQTSLQFLLNKDKATLDAILAQVNAINQVINNASAKVALATAQAQAHTQRAQYANAIAQLATIDAQYATAKENMEAARAQTSETKSDGTSVEGTVKRNNALLEAQKKSFDIRDKTNFFKFLMDWAVTAKTQDIGMATPDGLQNEDITSVLNSLKNIVGL